MILAQDKSIIKIITVSRLLFSIYESEDIFDPHSKPPNCVGQYG